MMDSWDWFWGAFMMVVVWGGLVAVIVIVLRAFEHGSRRRPDERTDAEAILETRFARGEISREEFEERMRVLGRAA